MTAVTTDQASTLSKSTFSKSQSPLWGAVALLQLALLGIGAGLVCWPLNLVDRLQDALVRSLPAFGGGWDGRSVALLLLPLPVMPLLLLLQTRLWPLGAGSGIPQTLVHLARPASTPRLMAAPATLQRLTLWSLASLALVPLGREGPVVQLGAALMTTLNHWRPGLLAWIPRRDRLAIAAAAGFAGAFNAPLVAVLFLVEELNQGRRSRWLWPALVVVALAALVSNLGGQPLYVLGRLAMRRSELSQVAWALPFGLLSGLLGGLFSRLLLRACGWLSPLARRHPWRIGLALGTGLALLALISGGASGGDGETLMTALLQRPLPPWRAGLLLLTRLIGPCLALGPGLPGGLIDPALSLGALFGHLLGELLGIGSLGLALAMAGCLAGATQLPITSLLMGLRLAGDQQLLLGLLLASVVGAWAGRFLQRVPIYHVLAERLLAESPAAMEPPAAKPAVLGLPRGSGH